MDIRIDNAEPNLARRYDRGEGLLELVRRNDGSIIASAVIVREGVLEYPQPDGSIRRELVNLDAVKATANSIAFRPMTLNHPGEGFVTLDSAGDLATGGAAGNAKVIIDENEVEGGHATVTIVLRRKDAVEAFDAGVREVSCGYPLLDLIEKPGVSDRHGPYDAIQVRGPTNHLAQVKRGRVENAFIRADSSDAVGTWTQPKPAAKTRTDRGSTAMKNPLLMALCALLDVSRFDSEDAALTEATANATALKDDNATLKADAEALQKRVDEFTEEEANEDAGNPIEELAAARKEIEALKAKLAQKDAEEEEMKADAALKALKPTADRLKVKHDGLSLDELRLAVAKTRVDSVDADTPAGTIDGILQVIALDKAPTKGPSRYDQRAKAGNRNDSVNVSTRADASDEDGDYYDPTLARIDKQRAGANP